MCIDKFVKDIKVASYTCVSSKLGEGESIGRGGVQNLKICASLNILYVYTAGASSYEQTGFKYTVHTVLKMGLILRSIEQMLKMKFSMARKFTLQPLRRYDVSQKTAQT
jgi:hypothetical protein